MTNYILIGVFAGIASVVIWSVIRQIVAEKLEFAGYERSWAESSARTKAQAFAGSKWGETSGLYTAHITDGVVDLYLQNNAFETPPGPSEPISKKGG